MRQFFLIVLGFLLATSGGFLLGVISIAVALLAKREAQRFWCLLLGVLLLIGLPSWWLGILLCFVFTFTDD